MGASGAAGGGEDGAGAEPGLGLGLAAGGLASAAAAPGPAREGAAGGRRGDSAADLHARALLRAGPRPPTPPLLLPPRGQRLAPHRYVRGWPNH